VSFQASYKESADGIVGDPRTVYGCRNGAALASTQPTHGFAQPEPDGAVLQPPQKTILRGVVGQGWQLQYGAQLLVLLQTYFGFAKASVSVAHQAKHHEQPRLSHPAGIYHPLETRP